jgi:hypothetical protein
MGWSGDDRRLKMLRARLSIRFMLILVAAIALILGLLSRRLQQQREALSLLQNLGGQLEAPTLGPLTLLTGMTVDNVRFLGPMIGDQEVPEIGNAAAILRLSRITLLETSVSDRGLAELRAGLPDVEIQMITPVHEVRTRRR